MSDQKGFCHKTKVDYLDEDVVTCGDLRYALISVVSRNGKQTLEKDDKIALKIRGAFASKEEAQAHIRRLMKTDAKFDIFMVDMYAWLLLPPDLERISDKVYQEEYLNDMLKEYNESQLRAKEIFQERKTNIMRDGLLPHLLPEERLERPEDGSMLSALEKNVHEGEAGPSSSSS
jgi:hypothetical protein